MSWLQAPLLRALRAPSETGRFGPGEWDLAIRQARSSLLLGRLGALVQQEGIEPPATVRRHFTAMDSIVRRQHGAVRWEVDRIAQALASTGAALTLLKGTAYVVSNAAAALGRTFSDVDMLVPKQELGAVESALQIHGWIGSVKGAYDQRYYRQWMHELPPMFHLRRRITLDVHHNILPDTARIKTRPELMQNRRRAVPGFANVHVPDPLDLVLHSACHLFHEGEWRHGLRDLSDLDLLVRRYVAEQGTAAMLEARAREMNLLVPLAYAMRCIGQVFQTPMPPDVSGRFERARWMDRLFLSAVRSAHHSLAGPSTRCAEALLYVRSHWLRMPPHLLVPHLLHQLFARETKDF